MPRNGSGVYSKPAGTTAVSGTTIESSKYNQTVDDLVNDANLARPVVAGGTGAATESAARVNLGLEIGADVQAYSANLDSQSLVGGTADRIMYTTGPNAWAATPLTSFMRTLLDDASSATARATLDASQSPLNEGDFASDSADRPPSQQSARSYIDNSIGALPFTEEFVSVEHTIVSGELRTLTHGLSSTPKLVQARLKFTSPVLGYSIGDEIIVEDHRNADETQDKGISVRLDSNFIFVQYGGNSNVFKVIDAYGSRQNVTNSDARLIIYAWA